MRTILRTVTLPRGQLTEYAAACDALSRCETSAVRGDISASTLREFKHAMSKNHEALTFANAQAEAECQTIYDADALRKFADAADAIKRAFARRDSRGAPKVIKREDGSEVYDIPETRAADLRKRMAELEAAHPEIERERKTVIEFGRGLVPVRLRAVPFRAIPCEVNGPYMVYIDAIVFAKPIYGLAGIVARPFQWLLGI